MNAPGWMDVGGLLLFLLALAGAGSVRPWRSLGTAGPPWPWLACWVVLPLFWSVDHWAHVPLIQPLSGVPLLLLMAGWPLTLLSLLPVGLILGLWMGLDWLSCWHQLVWLGLVPACTALVLGWAVRRWLPPHLFVYILARAFLGTWVVMALAGWLRWTVEGDPAALSGADVLLARALMASGEAFLTGMVVAIFVAFRPQWLATYADRLYLPKP
jgi:uncharacterized membrane protein